MLFSLLTLLAVVIQSWLHEPTAYSREQSQPPTYVLHKILDPKGGRLITAKLLPDDSDLVLVLEHWRLRLFDLKRQSARWEFTFAYPVDGYHRFFLDPQGGMLALDDGMTNVVLLEPATGRVLHLLKGFLPNAESSLVGAVFSDDGKTVFLFPNGGVHPQAFDIASGSQRRLISAHGSGECLTVFKTPAIFGCFTSWGHAVTYSFADPEGLPMTARMEAEPFMLPMHESSGVGDDLVTSVAYDFMGIVLSRLPSGETIKVFEPHHAILPFLFSQPIAYGRFLLTAGGQTFKVWDIPTTRQIAQYKLMPADRSNDFIVAFDASENGKALLFASSTALFVYRAAPTKPIAP